MKKIIYHCNIICCKPPKQVLLKSYDILVFYIFSTVEFSIWSNWTLLSEME